MNVSSVKNLNGETFSAVQDATLTDVVQSNSAQWGQGGGGASYTAGDNIDITNNVISVDDVSNLSAGDGINITQDSSYTTISWLNDAGIKNVVYTASLPATPDNNTLYLIPET